MFGQAQTRLRFAGADYASGWNGVVVDGAIESGLKTARALINEFRAGT
jgi:monoamine oxidase